MMSLDWYLLALFFVLLVILIFKVGTSYSFIVWSRSDEPNARSICNGDIVIGNPNPLAGMALLLRGRGNAAAQGQTMTFEVFLNHNRKEDINNLRIIAPVGSRLAWRINKKSAHGIIT